MSHPTFDTQPLAATPGSSLTVIASRVVLSTGQIWSRVMMALLFSTSPTGGLSTSSGYTVTSMCSMKTAEGQSTDEGATKSVHKDGSGQMEVRGQTREERVKADRPEER